MKAEIFSRKAIPLWIVLAVILTYGIAGNIIPTNAPATVSTATPTVSPPLLIPTITPTPQQYTVSLTVYPATFSGTVSVVVGTQRTVNCSTANVPHSVISPAHPVSELRREGNCAANVVDIDLNTTEWTLVMFSIGAPRDTIIGANHMLFANGTTPAVNGQYLLSPAVDSNSNVVILAAVPNALFISRDWSDSTVAEFAAIITSHNEDVCGWLRDEMQTMVDLLGMAAVPVWSIITREWDCGALALDFNGATPTLQVPATVTPTP